MSAHEAVKSAVVPNPGKPASRLQAAIQIMTLLSLLFVVMTPVAYFNGRAFHDGWYAYLHLDQQMFPLDTAGMLTEGAVAWGDALAASIEAVFKTIGTHWFVLLLMLLSGAMSWSAFTWIFRRMGEGGKARKERPTKRYEPLARLAKPIFSRFLVLVLIAAVACEAIALLTLGFTTLSLPFYQLGRYEAKKAVAINFEKDPVVIVKSAKGDTLNFREIGCGPQFCALWGNGHASTVPMLSITWSDSPPPDK